MTFASLQTMAMSLAQGNVGHLLGRVPWASIATMETLRAEVDFMEPDLLLERRASNCGSTMMTLNELGAVVVYRTSRHDRSDERQRQGTQMAGTSQSSAVAKRNVKIWRPRVSEEDSNFQKEKPVSYVQRSLRRNPHHHQC